MPEILLPDTTSITSSTASSLLLYTHPHAHAHQQTSTGTGIPLIQRKSKTLPLRRLSGWGWLSRRVSRQGLNATHVLPPPTHTHTHTHHHTHTHNDCEYDEYDEYEDEDETNNIISDPKRRKMRALEAHYEQEQEQARRRERDLYESYAAYCQAFTSAGQHQQQHQQRRKTWMMDGEVDLSSENCNEIHAVHIDNDDDDEDEKREFPAEPSPPPQILTPSLYAEMRRVACDKKRDRHRRLWAPVQSWFLQIRHRESH
ncbi:uncharacterized protein CDV56_100756 [Aspergillus thermomutatus]|uniref:Uncharacterized protein n=1 Tax=Aspergillus thermomutatus TaxID=41047 RepID=A0A397FXB4_ASPTH|nr:uncharacterized protein CDV56_100756 [Aspergillus thermomutatus]RHZ43412.1 hypothetical protein CDV56_100756 [Aspergillus thermomutatus]